MNVYKVCDGRRYHYVAANSMKAASEALRTSVYAMRKYGWEVMGLDSEEIRKTCLDNVGVVYKSHSIIKLLPLSKESP